MAQKRVGVINFASGTQSEAFKIPIKKPIMFIDLIMTGTLVVTGALTLSEDNVLRILRRIQLLLGGKVKKTIGDNSVFASAGRLLYYMAQPLAGMVPDFVPPGVGVATHSFKAALRIFVGMPEQLSKNLENGDLLRQATAMQPGSEDLELFVDWGTINDIFSAGAATFGDNPVLEVVVGYDDTINIPQAFEWQEFTQSLGIATGAGANSDFTDDLQKFGTTPYALLMNFDTALLSDAEMNRLRFVINEQIDILDGSWDKLKSDFKAFSGLQAAVPTGLALAMYDQQLDMGGAIQANDAKIISGWKVHVDHDALTATNRLYAHQFGLAPRT